MEADQKIIQHVLHSIKAGYSFIEIQSIDTVVLILLLPYTGVELVSSNGSSIYTSGVQHQTWYNNLSLIQYLNIDVCKALPYFHTFVGCNTGSSFNGKGKCTFLDTWMASKKKSN